MEQKLALRDRLAIRLLLMVAKYVALDPKLQQEIESFRTHLEYGKASDA